MKRIIEVFSAIFLSAGLLSALEINIVMKDGSVVKANMLGKTHEELYIEKEEGKSEVIKIADIKSVFDAATGTPVDLTVPANTAQNSSNAQPEPVPGPNTYTYYYDGGIIYYYGGYWWKPWDFGWYRASLYSGPWFIVEDRFVPEYVFYFGHRWRAWRPHNYIIIHHHR